MLEGGCGALQARMKCGCRFYGPFGYVGPTFADGNNFNLPTPKTANALKQATAKAVTILDMVVG
jgi:hypothetical protein